MWWFIARRVLWILPVLLVVTTVTFFLMYRAPGGPWDKQRRISPTTEAALDARFGLDKPLWFNGDALGDVRAQGEDNPLRLLQASLDSKFFKYLAGVSHGDFGPSYQSKGTESVQSVLVRRLPATLKLGVVGITFALLVGIPLGVLGALKQNTWIDYTSHFLATIGFAIPSFIIAVLVIVLFSSHFGIAPIRRPEEWDGISSAYLVPGTVLGLPVMVFVTRFTRSALLEIKHQDYVRTARAKGLANQKVVSRHMLRNALLPIVTIMGPATAELLTGSFIIESIFGVPGIGSEFVKSIAARDYSMIMGTTLLYAFFIAVANLVVDLSYAFIDPRIRTLE
ncbi:oligopeptide ABC transporter permease OppB [soil metagenome]